MKVIAIMVDLIFPTTTTTTKTNITTTTNALHTLKYGTFGDGGNTGFGPSGVGDGCCHSGSCGLEYFYHLYSFCGICGIVSGVGVIIGCCGSSLAHHYHHH